ncbi:response regulator [Aquisalinus flavus]|uniref:response regulator n=1 Tax=Aquisalinus flavus TaxID=1526572 RepID=UPI00165ED439|nr:response regulator [Aquisalinus flavus]MBD0425380.1 response regulator [Aquisalinus flavus]
MTLLFRHLKNFMWPPVEGDDHLSAARKRLLIIMSVSVLLAGNISNVLAIEDVLKRNTAISTFILIAPFLFVIPPLILRRKGASTTATAHLFLTLFTFASALSAYTGGGFFSLGTFYLAAVPPIAVLAIGLRAGLSYLAGVCLLYGCFYFLRDSLAPYDNNIQPEVFLYWNFVGLSILVLGITLSTLVYHYGMAAATSSLSQSRQEAHSGSRAKTEFLANMSHEIRTPLNGVLGMAQALQSRPLGSEERSMVDTIQDSGNTLLAILNDVLDLSKIEAGRTLLSPSDENLHTIFQRTHELFMPLAREKGLKLVLKLHPDVPEWVHVDAIRIRQCISNLVSNAVKFTEKGGVSVKVLAKPMKGRGQGHFITVSVTDTGIGIEEEKLAGLFQAFAQADASISRRYGGTGLGLTVARNLSQQMGGDITVESTPRVGSRFVFTFFAEPAEQKHAAEPDPTVAATRDRIDGVRVLVVDDQAVNRKVARIFLEEAGAIVTEAENGREALEVLETDHVDIMLLDVHMPVMDGIETIKRLRSDTLSGKAMPVIALTADAMSGAANRLFAVGMDGYLSKPVDRVEMVRSIRRVLSTRRASAKTRKSA